MAAIGLVGCAARDKSLVLIIDDPDAPDPKVPKMTWVHWVLYNLPANTTGLPEGALPAGTMVGLNDWKRASYGGPCPPIGRHRYFHKLYALNAMLSGLNSRLRGLARIFSPLCGVYKYEVTGLVTEGAGRIELIGLAPVLDDTCRQVGTKRDFLVFEYVGRDG